MSKAVDPSARGSLSATKDKVAGPNPGWKERYLAVAWCSRLLAGMKSVRADLFATHIAYVAMCIDPGANFVVAGYAISFDDDRATGVVLGNSRHQLRVVLQ